jgi:hypothetical protein
MAAPRERAARNRKVVRYDFDDYDKHMRVRQNWGGENNGMGVAPHTRVCMWGGGGPQPMV